MHHCVTTSPVSRYRSRQPKDFESESAHSQQHAHPSVPVALYTRILRDLEYVVTAIETDSGSGCVPGLIESNHRL